jgi:hypothetical protein
MSYENEHDISILNGRHIVDVTGLEHGSDEVVFVCSDGSKWRMVHNQDCCESVSIEDVVGDVEDLQDATVIDARKETSETDPADRAPGEDDRYRDSFTWTFYIIQTNKGAVTIRWLGESNGYYSESVDFECVREASA